MQLKDNIKFTIDKQMSIVSIVAHIDRYQLSVKPLTR